MTAGNKSLATGQSNLPSLLSFLRPAAVRGQSDWDDAFPSHVLLQLVHRLKMDIRPAQIN